MLRRLRDGVKDYIHRTDVLLMVLALAACASNASTDTTAPADSAAETEAPAEEAADSTAASGKLTMATEATFPPYEYYDGDAIVGIDVEVAQAIAAYCGK